MGFVRVLKDPHGCGYYSLYGFDITVKSLYQYFPSAMAVVAFQRFVEHTQFFLLRCGQPPRAGRL
jgi:hypothetical protein